MANTNPNMKGLKPFAPGHSGGPGRPKGSQNITTLIRKIVFEEIDVFDENGIKTKRPMIDQLIRSFLKPIYNEGSAVHMRELLNRLEGMPKQTIDQNTQVEWKPDLSSLSREQLDEVYRANQLGEDDE